MPPCRLFVFAAAIAAGLAAGAPSRADSDTAFASRDPAVCDDRGHPLDGEEMTADLVAQYLACDIEALSADGLVLAEDIRVRIDRPRPYRPDEDADKADIYDQMDLYPIRGSYQLFRCRPVGAGDAGSNCDRTDMPKMRGSCWMDTAYDWRCSWSGPAGKVTRGLPAP